jgi:hypothetical protein
MASHAYRDLNAGCLSVSLWQQPLGTSRDSGPFNIRSMLPIRMGVPAVGGPLVTRSGLIFIAATRIASCSTSGPDRDLAAARRAQATG